MSRLAAMKEFAFMKALRENGVPVPEPIAQNRHTVVMSLIDAFPLRQISFVPAPASLYSELIAMVLRLARFGLIHGDFNEFNILIKEEKGSETMKGKKPEGTEEDDENIKLVPILIDFPQMVSMDHPNAEMYFDRDINCIKRFFQRKFGFVSDEPGPFFAEAKKQLKKSTKRLDVEVEASGFSRKMARELEAYMKEVGADGNSQKNDGEESCSDSEDEDEDSDEIDEQDEEEEEYETENKEEKGVQPSNTGQEESKLERLHLSDLQPQS